MVFNRLPKKSKNYWFFLTIYRFSTLEKKVFNMNKKNFKSVRNNKFGIFPISLSLRNFCSKFWTKSEILTTKNVDLAWKTPFVSCNVTRHNYIFLVLLRKIKAKWSQKCPSKFSQFNFNILHISCIPVSRIPVSLFPCFHVSLSPCIPVSLYPCIPVTGGSPGEVEFSQYSPSLPAV